MFMKIDKKALPQADTIDSHFVVNMKQRHPLDGLHELHSVMMGIEHHQQDNRSRKRKETRDCGDSDDFPVIVSLHPHQHDDNGCDQRKKNYAC